MFIYKILMLVLIFYFNITRIIVTTTIYPILNLGIGA